MGALTAAPPHRPRRDRPSSASASMWAAVDALPLRPGMLHEPIQRRDLGRLPSGLAVDLDRSPGTLVVQGS